MIRAMCFEHREYPCWKENPFGFQLYCPGKGCKCMTGYHSKKRDAEREWNINYGSGNVKARRANETTTL